jgi:hypothetical protein
VERPATKYNLKNIRQVNYYRKTILQEYDWVYYLNLSGLLNLRGVSRMKYRLGFCDLPIYSKYCFGAGEEPSPRDFTNPTRQSLVTATLSA